MKFLKYFLLTLFIVSGVNAIAQLQVLPPNSVNVVLKPVMNQSTSTSFDTTNFSLNNLQTIAKVVVNVEDTIGIDSIIIRLGTTLGGNDLAHYTFSNDPNQTLPPNYSFHYFRKNYSFEMGQHNNLTTLPNYHCEVVLVYMNGQSSVPLSYSLE